MALNVLSYMKLPDVPYLEHQGQYNYLMELKRLVSRMSGDQVSGDRIVTQGDLEEIGVTTPRWDDLRFPATGSRIDTSAGRIDYNYDQCGIDFQANARYDNEPVCAIVQCPHGKKLGTPVRPHIHWEQNQNAMPNWLLEYRWVNNGDLRGTFSQAVIKANKFPYVSGNLQQLSEFPELTPPPTENVSSLLEFRLFRDSNNASGLFAGNDPYADEALFKEFDLHYQVDAFGSTDEYEK